tara:strand:+ start:111 stop:692 length:582 start_codon:yes stop_codon:yes gene_type:complete
MGTLQVGGTTLATKNVSTGKVDLNSTNTAFPAGHQVFIKKQTRTGTGGAVYRPTAFYPVTTSDLATKSFYLSITSTEHSPYTKILINYQANIKINKNTHNIADVALVRWEGTGNVASSTILQQGMIGSAVSPDSEEFCSVGGGIVDDISSVGDVQINYTLQYRTHAENSSHADYISFGVASNDKQQINAFGII